jgi:N-acetylmuramoyl-L-alanine amidase
MVKKLMLVAAVLVLALVVPSAVRASDPLPPVAGKTIAIDPGHGGPNDLGSTACMELLASEGVPNAELYYEKNVNLDIALRLQVLLEDNGAEVYLTRETDPDETLSNHDRAEGINASGAEVLLDLHLNGWTDPQTDGLYVLFGRARKDKAFALVMHDAMLENEALVDTENDFIDYGVRQLAAGVMLWTDMPSALLESAFISNAWECQQFYEGPRPRQEEIAQAIYEGLNAWFGEPQSPWGGKGKSR